MSDDVIGYGAPPLKGERISIPSGEFTRARVEHDTVNAALDLLGAWTAWCWPLVSFCGAIALWGAPALLLYRYSFDRLGNGLIRTSIHGTAGDLLILFAGLAYIVTTGLLLATSAARLASRLGRHRVVLPLAISPLILLSLAAAFLATVSFGLAVLLRCFPVLW
jgi:hypothetical protein